jgi:hypothetical protein
MSLASRTSYLFIFQDVTATDLLSLEKNWQSLASNEIHSPQKGQAHTYEVTSHPIRDWRMETFLCDLVAERE